MTRSWLINREYIEHIASRRFKGSVSAFANHTGIDKNTLRRWLQLRDSNATTYSSTVLQLAGALNMPAAAFAFRSSKEAGQSPGWLRALHDLSGGMEPRISMGSVLDENKERSYVRSWPYEAPRSRCWGLVTFDLQTPDNDLEIWGIRTIDNKDAVIQLGELKVRGSQCEVRTSWPFSERTWRLDGSGRLVVAMVYDDWPQGFIARGSAPFRAEETGRLVCGSELSRLMSVMPSAVVQLRPVACQIEPPSMSASCPHCQHDLEQPPRSCDFPEGKLCDGRPSQEMCGHEVRPSDRHWAAQHTGLE